VYDKQGFLLLADESNVKSKEQLAIVVRYVDEKVIIHEWFLTFVEATSLTAESLTTYLISTLTEYGLDPACIVSEGYNGACVMSGSCSGVQQWLRTVSSCAVYIHCYAHKLNLVLGDCVKSIQFTWFFLSAWGSESKRSPYYMFQQLMLASGNELLTPDEHADDKDCMEDISEVITRLLETQQKA